MSGVEADRLEHIAVIGAGLAGRSFSRLLLSRGYRVTIEDVLPSNLRRAADEMEAALKSGNGERFEMVSTVEDAVRSADLAIDFVPDELESKLEILSMIDRMAPPRTILLTPTETLSISDLASCTYRPERCFGMAGISRHDAQPIGEQVLLHPAVANPVLLARTLHLLTTLNLDFTTRLDPFPSMLVGR